MLKLPSLPDVSHPPSGASPPSQPADLFSVHINSGYNCYGNVYMYPSIIEDDKNNQADGKLNIPNQMDGKVFFPIAWPKDDHGNIRLPKAPNGHEWPIQQRNVLNITDGQGHAVSDPTNVINAVAFFIDFHLTSTGGDTGGDLTFTGVRDFHFSSGNGIPPPPSGQKTDPSIADKMPQLYISNITGFSGTSNPPFTNPFPYNYNWSVDLYTEVRYGWPRYNNINSSVSGWIGGFYYNGGAGLNGNGGLGPLPKINYIDEGFV
jgi:hypothetical protein